MSPVPSEVALAHAAGQFYVRSWDVNAVHWHFNNLFPQQNFRARFVDATDEWNSLGPKLHFDKDPDSGGYAWQTCNHPAQDSVVQMNSLGGTMVLAQTTTCVSSAGVLKSFQTRFDGDQPWYTGSSTPPPGNEFDFQSLATHELGHATGFGQANPPGGQHFDDSDDACANAPFNTMCSLILTGDAFWRSLETHDRHTFANQY